MQCFFSKITKIYCSLICCNETTVKKDSYRHVKMEKPLVDFILKTIFDKIDLRLFYFYVTIQKQPPRGDPRKRCSENIQQIYRRTPMPKCAFNKVAKQPN